MIKNSQNSYIQTEALPTNQRIATIVARQNELRTAIDSIVYDLENA